MILYRSTVLRHIRRRTATGPLLAPFSRAALPTSRPSIAALSLPR
jgi:hypothetical protein